MRYKSLKGAVLARNTEGTKYYLDQGANPNQKVVYGITLLQHAIRGNSFMDGAILLIKYGAKVNTQDALGNTPLHEAVEYRNMVLVWELVKNGANPFTKNFNNVTAVMLAESNGHKEIASLLRTTFIPNYSRDLFFSFNGSFQKNEDQNKPLDLSKTGPYAAKVNRIEEPEEIVVEVDPQDVLCNIQFRV